MKERPSTLRVLNTVFRGYRANIAKVAFLGTLAALIDGITISTIIPLVSFFLGPSAEPYHITIWMQRAFEFVHLPFKFRVLLMFVVCLIVARMGVQALFVFERSRTNARYIAEATKRTFENVFDANWEFVVREKGGHVQHTILWDPKRVGDLLRTVMQFTQSISGFSIYLLVAITISPTVTAITLVAGGVLLVFLRPVIVKTRRFGEEMNVADKELAHAVSEQVGGFKTVKAAGVTAHVQALARSLIERYRRAHARALFIQSLGTIFIQPFGLLFAIALFSVSYLLNEFNLAAFAALLYLIQKIFVYLDSTQVAAHTIQQGVPYAESLLDFEARARAHHEKLSSGTSFSFERDIVFDDVSLSYEGRTHALSNVSFSIPRGSFLGIIGPSGGGKTSLVDLLLRLFAPTGGTITVDGTPLQSFDLADWRRHVAYVSQENFLMHASVADNIRFFDDSLTREDIERAARMAHVYDDIQSLPQGFDTVLGDRGITLSGGQRQRIALARALARKPHVLVLDEVTSALDSAVEAQIKEVIDGLRGQMTLVVIAHRVSTILNADKIIVLEKGSIAETASPAQMLENPHSYLARMRDLQRGQVA